MLNPVSWSLLLIDTNPEALSLFWLPKTSARRASEFSVDSWRLLGPKWSIILHRAGFSGANPHRQVLSSSFLPSSPSAPSPWTFLSSLGHHGSSPWKCRMASFEEPTHHLFLAYWELSKNRIGKVIKYIYKSGPKSVVWNFRLWYKIAYFLVVATIVDIMISTEPYAYWIVHSLGL